MVKHMEWAGRGGQVNRKPINGSLFVFFEAQEQDKREEERIEKRPREKH